MRISEMSTEQARRALCLLADPVASIVGDKKLMEAMAQMTRPEDGGTVGMRFGGMIRSFLPLLLEDHAAETYAIIAALTDKTAQQVSEQRFLETLQDVKGMVDRELVDFFTQSASAEKTPS